METTSLQIELVYLFLKFSIMGNVYCIYFSYWRLHWCFRDVIEVQRLEIQSIFGRYGSQHLDDTVTFKCWWNIGRLSVVYNTMRFRVFLKASSILETSSTGDQKCYRPYDTTTSTSMKTSLNNRLHILLNICAIILICHVTLIKKKGILFGAEERWPRPILDSDIQQLIQRSIWEVGGRTGISALLLYRRF